MNVSMYVPVGKANLLCGWINTDSPSLVPRPSAVGGKAWYTLFVHAPNFPDIPVIQTRKYTRVPRNYRNVGKFGACANSVYQAFPPPPPPPPARKVWERGYASPYISKCLLLDVPIQCTMYGAVRQTYICLFKLTICFSILLKVLWKLCTGTHTVGSPTIPAVTD